MKELVGLLLALGAMFGLELSYIGQQQRAAQLPRISLAKPVRAMWTLVRDLRWLAAFLFGIVGWGLYIVALKFAPISLVQSVLAGGLAFLVIFVAWWEHARPVRGTIVAVVVAIVGLCVLAADATDQGTGVGSHPDHVTLWCVLAGAVLLALILFGAGMRLSSAALAGGSAGLFYGIADVSVKGLEATVGHHAGLGTFVSTPLLYMFFAGHILAFVVIQLAFQRGSAVASIGPMTIAMNVLPIAAGFVVFHDPLPHSNVLKVVQSIAFVVVLVAAWVLARAEHSHTPARVVG